jgi:hypothetical protein
VATVDDVAVALGRPTSSVTAEEDAQWSMWIADALMLIEARLGDSTLLDQARLDFVVREAVKAMVLRPDDATQVDIAVDDGQVSKRYSSSSGRVTILDEWWELLLAEYQSSGAFSVRPYGESDLQYCWP